MLCGRRVGRHHERWSRDWLLSSYGLDPGRVHVAHPGVDASTPVTGTADGGALLCVGAVTPGKGHDLLLAALEQVAGPAVAMHVRRLAVGGAGLRRRALQARVGRPASTTGSSSPDRCPASELDAAYAEADVLVLASRAETYGMVVTEALSRGLPVIAADVGGVPEALGFGADGDAPGPARASR